jgi:pimeloyl-ACP methyl ester carboxylesterase
MNPSDWGARKRYAECHDGRTVAYVDTEGTGRTVVLIHGFTDSSRSFAPLEPYLADMRLIMPDLRGHGDSHRPEDAYRIVDFAEDIACLMEALVLRDALVVGHSLGAMVALDLAASRPNLVGALITISCSLKPEIGENDPICIGVASLQDPIDPANAFFDTWHACNGPVDAKFLAELAQEAAAIPARLWRRVLQEIRASDLTEKASLVRQASLIIHGSADPLFSIRQADALRRRLGRSVMIELPGCGHNPHWEQPQQVSRTLRKFNTAVESGADGSWRSGRISQYP